MLDSSDPADGSRALYEEHQDKELVPERQRAAAEHRERGQGESTVARVRLLSADLHGHQPGGRDGGRLRAVLQEQGLLSKSGESRVQVRGLLEDVVPAEAGENREDSRTEQDAVPRRQDTLLGRHRLVEGQVSQSDAPRWETVESGHRPRFTQVREHGQHGHGGSQQVSDDCHFRPCDPPNWSANFGVTVFEIFVLDEIGRSTLDCILNL